MDVFGYAVNVRRLWFCSPEKIKILNCIQDGSCTAPRINRLASNWLTAMFAGNSDFCFVTSIPPRTIWTDVKAVNQCMPRLKLNFGKFHSIPEIHKLHGHGKFMGAHGGDDGLQFVAALAVHAHLVALNLRRHLELAVADEAGNLLGHRALDALLDLDALPRVAQRRDVRLGLLNALHADAALGEPADDDFIQRADFEIVVGGELDLGFLQHDLPLAGFEIKEVGQFLFGLVDGV